MYNMVPYKLNVVHVEYGIQNLPPIRQNINAYPREQKKGKKCGADSSIVPLDDEHLCDTIISINTYISCNKTLEIRDSFRYNLHIGDVK